MTRGFSEPGGREIPILHFILQPLQPQTEYLWTKFLWKLFWRQRSKPMKKIAILEKEKLTLDLEMERVQMEGQLSAAMAEIEVLERSKREDNIEWNEYTAHTEHHPLQH